VALKKRDKESSGNEENYEILEAPQPLSFGDAEEPFPDNPQIFISFPRKDLLS